MQHKSNHAIKKLNRCGRPTLGTITKEVCTASSRSLWAKAMVASSLRHEVSRRYDIGAARVLSDLKLQSIRRAVELAPQMYKVSIDSEYQIVVT